MWIEDRWKRINKGGVHLYACTLISRTPSSKRSDLKHIHLYTYTHIHLYTYTHNISKCYARAIKASGVQFDVVFGPAYKGITLAAGIAFGT